jgi:hypothetical protein
MSRPTRRRLAAWLGVTGGGVGILAGLVQTVAGSQIPDWSGAKADPRALGLLTVALSALALLAALRQARPGLTTGPRGLAALALLVPGLLCLTTVGRLWYLPGLLLVSAGVLTVHSWTDTASVVRQNWLRCLLSGLGACQLLMAAGGTGGLAVVGLVSGLALIGAALWPNPQRWALLGLIIIGTVPFGALAWTALVPVLVVLVATAVAVPLLGQTSPAGRPT